MYYLGVDGGGTHTSAVVADKNGNIVAKADGKSINYNSIGFEAARYNMREIVSWLSDACGADSFRCAFIGMSAISERADEELTTRFCEGIVHADRIIMDSDVYIALSALSAKDVCAVAISGTGSMAAGRKKSGEIIHTGGWGYILGDEGSSYTIALDSVKAAVRGYEKSSPETSLTDAAIKHFGAESIPRLIDIFYDPPMERSKIASFTPRVFECAEGGDTVALSILNENARQLSDTCTALLRELEDCDTLGLWGGVFVHHEDYINMFSNCIKNEFPDINVKLLACPPVIGAVTAAIREDGTDE